MQIENKNMKVLFDSGASISLITQKGINLLPHVRTKPTNTKVWAANNQRIKLEGEADLFLKLRNPLKHRFIITKNNISGCHALIGTDIYPKLDSFFLTGIKDVGLALNLNGTSFTLLGNSNQNIKKYPNRPFSTSIFIIKPCHTIYAATAWKTTFKPDLTFFQTTRIPQYSYEVYKLLDEDFEIDETIRPISELHNGLLPDIEYADSDHERSIIFGTMLNNLDLSHLSHKHVTQLKSILNVFDKLFITTPEDPVGLIPNCIVPINTTPGEPIRSKARKFSPQVAKKIKTMNTSMLKRNIIEKSSSDWSNPVVLVKKPGSSTALRMCLDLRALNKRIRFDSYPVPDMKSILQSVSGYTIYTTLDISEAYFCMLIDPKDRFKLAYRTPDGLFQFCRLPFGILTGCALWNRAFQEILSDLGPNVQSYFDDLIIFSNDVDQHLHCLKATLLTLLNAGLRIKLSKCQFAKENVKFLGFQISADGSSPTPDGVTSVRALRRPETTKQLRSFLGAIGYFRDFIPSFAQLAVPLYDLTKKKSKFTWNEVANSAWETLKSVLSSDLILAPPNPNQRFYIATDATQTVIAAVLLQRRNGILKPIEYFSKRLKGAETRYHTNEIEGLAIFAAVKRWHHFLLMNNFTVMTDNSAMTYLFDRKEPCNARVARWQIYLATFSYNIIHVKGRDNHLADYLSRNVDHDLLNTLDQPTSPPTNVLLTISSSTENDNSIWLKIQPVELRQKQEAEPRYSNIIKYLEGKQLQKYPKARPKISCLSDFILNDAKVLCVVDHTKKVILLKPVIPNSLIPMVLSFIHDSVWAGHPSPRKTRDSAIDKFYWPTMINDSLIYAKSCIPCQKFFEITRYFPDNIGSNKIIPTFPNEALSIDIMYMQPAYNGDKYILSIMDMFSRFSIFYPLRNMYADTISNKIADYCCEFGFPKLIFTDDAANLSAAMSRNIFAALQVSHSVSIPYRHNPSMVERVHYPLKKALSILSQGVENSWPKYLKKATYALNTTTNGTLGCTPMEAYFFRQHNPQPNIGNISLNEDCDTDMLNEIKSLRETLIKLSIENKAKYVYDKNKYTKPTPELSINDKVMMKREVFLEGINRKMQPIRLGPWTVSEVSGSEITIRLIKQPDIIRRRHISHLAPFIDRPTNLRQQSNDIMLPPPTQKEPTTAIGDFRSQSLINKDSIIIVGIECHLRKAGGLSKVILETYPYGSPYSGKDTITNPDTDQLYNLLRARPPARREPGCCILKIPKTRGKKPIIANLTIQYFPGRASDDNGLQNLYISENQNKMDNVISKLIQNDTLATRNIWFSQAIDHMQQQLQDLRISPSTYYVPKYIGCGYLKDEQSPFWSIIQTLAARVDLKGIELIAIEKPKP